MTAQAMSSIAFLSGSWHCTGDGPPEDDVNTIGKKQWRDTDSLGGLTMGTFNATSEVDRLLHGRRCVYGVNEGTPLAKNAIHLTIPYPPGMSSRPYSFTKLSDTEFVLGKQNCTKK
jgi:hypothetical protein